MNQAMLLLVHFFAMKIELLAFCDKVSFNLEDILDYRRLGRSLNLRSLDMGGLIIQGQLRIIRLALTQVNG